MSSHCPPTSHRKLRTSYLPSVERNWTENQRTYPGNHGFFPNHIFVIKEVIGMMNEPTNTGMHVDNDKNNWETSPNHTKTTLLIYGVSSRCASPQSQRIRIEIFTFYSRELFTRKKSRFSLAWTMSIIPTPD